MRPSSKVGRLASRLVIYLYMQIDFGFWFYLSASPFFLDLLTRHAMGGW